MKFAGYALIIVTISLISLPIVSACKDVVVNNGTAGNYSLFMKIRDPSRPGLQVLFMANKGYEYTYHNPWKNEPWVFRLNHKIIGVATKGDTPPNAIKAGMMMSDAAIVYGDADSPTAYINPTKYAWDDFDWLMYAAENASSVDEAMSRLEKVTEMHAPKVGENLFVVGANKAYVAEADAIHFLESEINGVEIQSNYPKMLWDNRLIKKIIANSFDKVFEGSVSKWHVVRLGGLLGVRITKIGENWVVVRQVPFGEKVRIDEGKGSKVGNFWVELIECNGKSAKIKVCYEYYQWENILMKKLMKGGIDVKDLMDLSRLTTDDLNGLRGMSEGENEGAMIFKIPKDGYDKLTMGWFAPNQRAAIYVPVHICDNEIYEPYTTGDAANVALNLLLQFDKVDFRNVENVFINENDNVEKIAEKNYDKASLILTASDTGMQKQALALEELWMNINDNEKKMLINLWNESYYKTICNMERNINKFDDYSKEVISKISLDMCNARVEIEKNINGSDYTYSYEKAKELADKGKYKESMKIIESIFSQTDEKLFGIQHEKNQKSYGTIIAGMVIAALILLMIYIRRRK